jgi:endonuclease/exonuclease/phosphatase family metal-dependent hydrolase
LLVAALVLAVWAATCFVDRPGPGMLDELLVVAATLSPFIAVVAIPLVTFTLRGRHWVSAAITLVAALLPWLFVLSYASPTGTAATGPEIRAMVLTAHDGAADAPSIVHAVREHGVDVLVVTELSGLLAHELTEHGLDAALRPRWVSVPDDAHGGTRAGIGMWSRFPVTSTHQVPGTTWPAVRAQLDTGQGTFTLIGGHAVPPVPDGAARWRADLAALSDAAQTPGPVLLLANLNATPWHPAFRKITRTGLTDAADAAGRGLRSTWPSALPISLIPLDHALVGGGIAVRSVDTIPVAGTDHRALLATLRLPASTPADSTPQVSPSVSPGAGAP